MNLAELAQYAAGNAQRASNTPLHELSIEEARKVIKIVDGNKVKKDDQQALTLQFGRRKLTLDAISDGATRLNVPTANVEGVTTALTQHIANGDFDKAIKQAQQALKDAKAKSSTPVAKEAKEEAPVSSDEKEALVAQEETVVEETTSTENETPSIDGLDLSSIE